MKVKIENAGGCRRVMNIESADEEVSDVYGKVVEYYRRGASVPGFRRGKAPAELVQRRYAKEINEETKERLLPLLYNKAISEEKIDVASVVDVADIKFDPSSGISFRVSIDLVPEFKLPKYKKISLSDETKPVTDKDIDTAISTLRERFAKYEAVTDRGIIRGDVAQIDYTGQIGDKSLVEICPNNASLAGSKDFWALVDEPEFIPGIVSGLQGMAVGETRKIAITFPSDYHVENLRGLSVDYSVTVKAIRRRVLPEMTEDFIKSLGFENETKLREHLKSELEKNAIENEKNRRLDEIAKFLLENVSCELPESLVARETDIMTRSLVRRFAYQGATRDEIQKRSSEIVGLAHRSSTDRVKLDFILKRIAKEENISIDDKELEEGINKLASARKQTPEQVRSALEKNGSIDSFRNNLLLEKTMNFLLDTAKIN